MASVARTGFRACVIGAAQTLMLGVALAQSPIQPRDPNMPDPKTTIPEKIRPEEPDTPLKGRFGQIGFNQLGILPCRLRN